MYPVPKVLTFLIVLLWTSPIAAQRMAIVTPIVSDMTDRFADELATALSPRIKVLDRSMSMSAFNAVAKDDPLNMTTAEARTAGSAIGADSFVIILAKTLRRTSFERPEYYESYAAIYLVSTRTGKLLKWTLQSSKADNAANSENQLVASVAQNASAILAVAQTAAVEEPRMPALSTIEELPADGSHESLNFRAPVPYRRIKPEYTSTAYLFDVAATVEIELTLDAAGGIVGAEVTRWAGYGLDESAIKAVRSMNWRAAERDGKSLPIRVLLRYNFKKLGK